MCGALALLGSLWWACESAGYRNQKTDLNYHEQLFAWSFVSRYSPESVLSVFLKHLCTVKIKILFEVLVTTKVFGDLGLEEE